MANTKIRDYEVSIWSLQDDFIAVLKTAYVENKGQITEPKLKLSTDGTQELSFSIPMYMYQDGVRVANPAWYNTKNGNLIINMRKIKVILNKYTDDEGIFDFMITKVTERHETDELYCDVTCEGLAFSELGKIGYKIFLSSEDFYNEDYEWFVDEREEAEKGQEPQATLDYWLRKFLQPYDETQVQDAHTWYYEVRMDWSAFKGGNKRESSKVYEEPYVSAWDENLAPKKVENYKEKARMIDLQESNIYNLTQDIAKTFGVFCRYEYQYDMNYHIIGRKIVFYNNYMQEKEGYISLTYPYDTDNITREIDSGDTITKLFVKSANNDASISGLSTIMDIQANKSLEDYILNFDYCHKTGAITAAQYQEIEKYEKTLRNINTALIPLSQQIENIEKQLPEIEATITVSENAIGLDEECLGKADKLFNELDSSDGKQDGVLSVSVDNPVTAVPMKDTSANNGSYYFNIKEKGVIPDSLRIYKTIDYTKVGENRLSNQVYTGVAAYDEFGNLNKITNIWFDDSERSKIIYLVYDYNHKTYYGKVVDTWTSRLEKDRAANAEAKEKHSKLQAELDSLKETRDNLLSEQRQCRADFEKYMGPALREGYWQPEDFNDYGENFNEAFAIPVEDSTETENTDQLVMEFIWDNDLFEEEQKGYYEIGAAQVKYPYPIIKLNNECLAALNQQEWQDINLIFKNTVKTDTDTWNFSDIKCYALGSQLQLVFIKDNTQYTPALLVTGAELLAGDELAVMQSTGRLGSINITEEHTPEINTYYTIKSTDWIVNKEVQDVYYPRVQINSVFLKATGDQIALKYNGTILKNYEDYSILFRDGVFLLSLKPFALLKNTSSWETTRQLQVKFSLSNADISIYLDALQVAQENAQPKVSYEVTPSGLNKDFIYNDYNKLARIVNINDTDLKFENVQGYISELELDLAEPWNDSVTIKNYKTKFEDLFSAIVAQTEAMKKSEYTIGLASNLFMSDGQLSGEVVKNSLSKVNLDYAFNNGKLTIDDKNGIIGLSDAGVVAMRGGGIFTATEKDASGNWIWNTGIVPQGINADLITTGQLDTNRIKIYAGDRAQFQFNSTGLYAYRTFLQDYSVNGNEAWALKRTMDDQATVDGYDPAQYIVFNSDGLTLRLNDGALVLNPSRTAFVEIANGGVDKVKLSWDGLTLRDNQGNKTLSMDPEDGNLYLAGTVYANRFRIIESETASKDSAQNFTEYLAGVTKDTVAAAMQAYKDTENTGWVNNTLKQIFDDAGEILNQKLTDNIDVQELYNIPSNDTSRSVLQQFIQKIPTTAPVTYSQSTKPTSFQPGDIWIKDDDTRYIAMEFSSEVDSSKDNADIEFYAGWNRIYDGSIQSITSTKLDVNANQGHINLEANGEINVKAGAIINIATDKIQITGNEIVNIGGQTINIGGGAINLVTNTLPSGITTGPLEGTLISAVSLSNQGISLNASKNTTTSISTSTLSLKGDQILLNNTTTKSGKSSSSSLLIDSQKLYLQTGESEITLAPEQLTLGVIVNNSLDGGIQITKEELLFRAVNTQIKMSGTGLAIGTFKAISVTEGGKTITKQANPSSLMLDTEQFYLNAGGIATLLKDGTMILAAKNDEDAEDDEDDENQSDYDIIKNSQDNAWTGNVTTDSNGNISITKPAASGIKISNDGIWLASAANNQAGMVKITPSQVYIGQINNSGLTGSFIDLSENKIRIGSSTNIEIGATNIGLYTANGKETASITKNNTTASYPNVHFRLGESNNPKLLFAGDKLIIDGTIMASSLIIDGGEQVSLTEKIDQVGGAAGKREAETYAQDKIRDEVQTYLSPDISKAVSDYLNKNGWDRGQKVYVGDQETDDSFKKNDLWYKGDKIYQAEHNRTDGPGREWEDDWELIGRQSGMQTFTGPNAPAEGSAVDGDIWYKVESDGSISPKKMTNKRWVDLNLITDNTNTSVFTGETMPSDFKVNDIWYQVDSNNKITVKKATYDSNPWKLLAPTEQQNIIIQEDEPSDPVIDLYWIDTSSTTKQLKRYSSQDNSLVWAIVTSDFSYESDEPEEYDVDAYWYNTTLSGLYQAQYGSSVTNDSKWSIVVNPGIQTFTTKPTSGASQGDLLYTTDDDGNLKIQQYNNGEWRDVSLPIPENGAQIYKTDKNNNNLPSTSYHEGDIWYKQQSDNTYVIYRANKDYKFVQGKTVDSYIETDWDIINLPYGNGAQHLFYSATFPTTGVNENDILYKPHTGSQGSGFDLYVASIYDINDIIWEQNILNDGNIISKDKSDTWNYQENDYCYLVDTEHLYRCKKTMSLQPGEVISIDDSQYWEDLGQTTLFWTNNDAVPSDYAEGDYWAKPVNTSTTGDITMWRSELYRAQLNSSEYQETRSRYIKTFTKNDKQVDLYWLPYSYPEIKGAKLVVNANEGYVNIGSTDEINIVSKPNINSFNNVVEEGGVINIKGTTINIEASSSLRLGYTETINTDDQSILRSGVLIDSEGIRMYSDTNFIVSAGNKIQITSYGRSENYIQFGKDYDNATAASELSITDEGIEATTANFTNCFVNGSRVLTRSLITYPIIYSATRPSLDDLPGETFIIWLRPGPANTSKTNYSQTKTRGSDNTVTKTDKNTTKISRTSSGDKSYTYTFTGTTVTTTGDTSIPEGAKITQVTAVIGFNVIASEDSSKTGTPVVTAKFSNGAVASKQLSPITGNNSMQSDTLAADITNLSHDVSCVTLSAYWNSQGNPGLYAWQGATLSIITTYTHITASGQTTGALQAELIALQQKAEA